jgi:hypothetical protein
MKNSIYQFKLTKLLLHLIEISVSHFKFSTNFIVLNSDTYFLSERVLLMEVLETLLSPHAPLLDKWRPIRFACRDE